MGCICCSRVRPRCRFRRWARTSNPGEACGEISFLDELPATANVVAKEEVEAYYLDRPTLQSMFELFPHLGSRFYQSLAAILSRRLRELIGPGETGQGNGSETRIEGSKLVLATLEGS